MAEPKINGIMRIVDGSTNLRTLKELNTLLTTLNNNLTTLMNFSTSEQIVGKWIDGKTLYRKVLTKTSNGSARDVSIPTPNNIDTMVHMEVMGIRNGEQTPFPNNSISYANGSIPRSAVFLDKNASWNPNHIYVVEVLNYTYFFAIIYYTKV